MAGGIYYASLDNPELERATIELDSVELTDVNSIECSKIKSKLSRTFSDNHSLKILIKGFANVDVSKQFQTSDFGGELSQDDNLSDSLIYREFGDHEPSDVNDVRTLSYRGTGYTRDNVSVDMWADLLNRTGTMGSGGYYRHKGKVYRSTGSAGVLQKF